MKRCLVRIICFFSIMLLVISNGFGMAAEVKTDLDFAQTELRDVFRALASQFRVDIFIDEDVKDVVTLHLSRVTLKEAFTLLEKTYRLSIRKEGSTYNVSRRYEEFFQLKVEEEELLTIETRDYPLTEVLKKIRETYQINLISPEDKQRITLTLYKVPLKGALDTIAQLAGYTVEEQSGILAFRSQSPVSGGKLLVRFKDGLVSIEAQNAPISLVAREITQKTGVSVVPDNNLNNTVSVFFQELPLEDGLRVLASANSLRILQDKPSLYRIIKGSGGGFRVNFQDELLSVNATGIDISLVLEEIARATKTNIIYEQDVRGPINAQFERLSLAVGLNAMLEANSYSLDIRNEHYYVRRKSVQGGIHINYNLETGLFDLEITNNATLNQILSQIAQKADLNMVVYANVNAPINNIFLSNMNIDQVISYLLRGTTFTYKWDDKTILVGDGANLRLDNDLIENHIFYLENITAENLLNTLPPNFPRQFFVVIKEQNAISASGTAPFLVQVENYIKELDKPENRLRTEVIRVKHIKAEEVLKLFPASIPKTDLMVIKEANAIAITGTNAYIEKVVDYVEQIDLTNPLILFDVMVVQFSNRDDGAWGVQSILQAETGDNEESTSYSSGQLISEILIPGSKAAERFKVKLAAMIKEKKAKIWANPQVTALNGSTANFNVTTKEQIAIPNEIGTADEKRTIYNVIAVETGLQVSLVPWVSATDDITVEIKPRISESIPSSAQTSDSSSPAIPNTSQRSVETTVRVRDSETIIIGGLRQKIESHEINKVPILGSIPLIGHLFRYTSKNVTENEFVIVITPRLIDDGVDAESVTKEIINNYSTSLQDVTEEFSSDK
jgi:type II secretory pathway component GspD/PulD (secretin)